MREKRAALRLTAVAFAVALSLGLSGCGGGGGGGSNVRPSTPPPPGTGSGGSSDPDVTFDSSDSATWSNDIGGTGGLIKDGTGTLVLVGSNTYTGGTTINQGTLQIGNGGTAGSIVGDVKDDGALVFDRSDNVTFGGRISGKGSLEQAGTGRLALTGGNTYTGGTTISHGTLQIGNGGTAGWITGDVTDNGALVFDHSNDVTFDGDISGKGSLEQAGTGRLTLTGGNTYTGGTTISHGTLQLGNGGTVGWITGNVTDNGALVFDHSDDVTFDGDISGKGSLEQAGTGRLTLTGGNTYTGGTTISHGTLQLGNGGTVGWITGDVTDNGALVFDRSDEVSFTGAITGKGSLEQSGAGTLILTGRSSYAGGTTISRGTLQIGNGGDGGSITGNVVDNGVLVFNRRSDPAFRGVVSGAISGSGSLTQAGTDTLILTGRNTYTGGTTINGGTLQVGNYGATGSIVGDVVDNGSLVFAPGGELHFGGTVSGNGTLTKTGGGTLVLTGASTYNGGTTVTGGTLEVASGAALGTGTVTVGDYFAGGQSEQKMQVDGGAVLSNHIVLDGYGSLDNAGTLGGSVDNAVEGISSATISNHDGGRISATNAAVTFGSNSGTIENSGGATIEGGLAGVDLNYGGRVTNDGAGSVIRSSGGTAISISGSSGTVENTGGAMIFGGPTGIYLEFGGQITNGVGSVIEATGSTGGACEATGPCAIFVDTDRDLPPEDGSLRLVNDGTIIGNVQLFPYFGNEVSLSVGSSIHGDLDIGPGSLSLNGSVGSLEYYSHAVTGKTTFTGGLIKAGEGTWIIDNDDLTPSGVTISSGTLQFGTGGTEGSIPQGDVAIYHGKLVFDRGDDVVFDGAVSSGNSEAYDGTLVQAGGGKLTLTNHDISPTSIEIRSGTLQIGNTGDLPGSDISSNILLANVANDGSLIFDSDLNLFYYGAISGTGKVTQNGSSALILVARNSYSGGTTVSRGALWAAYVLPGDATVSATGTLDGFTQATPRPGLPGVSGNLANAGKVYVRKDDTLVGGNYTQASTGTLAVSLGSKLDVAGSATLAGGTLEIAGADSGYVSNTHTNVLTAAGGVNGTFDRLVKDSGVVFTATTINYSANSVWLDTTGLDVTTAAAGQGVSYTPVSMGSAVRVQGTFAQLDDKIAASNLTGVSGEFLSAAGEFQQAPTLLAAQASLQSLSGELHAVSAAMTFEAIDASDRVLSDRFDSLLDQGTGAGVWMHNLSIGGDMARAGYGGVDFQVNGWLVGSDRMIGQSGMAGFAFGQSLGQQRLERGFDHERSRSTEAMAYTGWLDGNRYVLGRVGFGRFQQDVSRQILLGYGTHGVSTQYNGSYGVAYGESGLHFGQARGHVVPFVSVQYARIDRDGFAEQGAAGFGLRSNAQALDRWQAGLGVRAGSRWVFGGGRALDVSAHAQWQRTLASHGDVFSASFVGLEQWQPLVGIGLSRYGGLLGFNLDATLSSRTTLQFGYDYQVGQRDNAQALSSRLNVAF